MNDPIRKFLDKIDTSGGATACWLWAGAIGSDGYGRIRREGKTYSAHRYSYAVFKMAVPAGMCVLHRCDNTRCVNPTHLFLGTKLDNTEDMRRKGRTGDATRRLTEREVEGVRRRIRSGESKGAVAEAFGICRSTVQDLAHETSHRTSRENRQLSLFEAQRSGEYLVERR